jgi:hypothetical protein
MPAGLYPRLLGSDWSRLDETVRRFHVESTSVQASGSFQIRHGNSMMAKWLLWLLGMPSAGEAVPAELVVCAREGGEIWRRTFAGRRLTTTQFPFAGDLLAERLGAVELRFRLEVAAGALVYRQMTAALRIGPLTVPLPRWLRPQVDAREEPAQPPDQAHVIVQVLVPLVGLLIHYEGTIKREEAA